MASWTDDQNRISAPLPASAASIVAIDTLSPQKNPPMISQATLESPRAQPAVLEAEPASLPAVSADAKPTTDDSFLRHDTYFFKDGNITFLVRVALLYAPYPLTRSQVDRTLYCVHQYFFSRDSVYFSAKFSQLGVRDHESLNTIVSLGDVECKDFEAFLSVIYPM
jgi:hypothetical protein